MAATVLPVTYPTLLDQIKRTDPRGGIAKIIEALQQRNPILMDANVQEGNLPTGHRTVIRSGLPSVGWRRINEGTDPSKSTTEQVDETCGELVGRSVVDRSLARINGNEAAFRASEDKGFLQSMNNEVASTLFYGSTKTHPEKFHGLSPRYDALTANENSANVIDCSVASSGSDQLSMWFITWGPETAYMIYPKGSKVGLEMTDLGLDYEVDRNNKRFLAYRTHFTWNLGLVIADWRYHVRICNIDKSAITATGSELVNAMVEAYNQVYDMNMGRTVIYANRTLVTKLDLQVMNKANIWFAPMEWHGRKITGFRGIPIVQCDALIDEAIVA